MLCGFKRYYKRLILLFLFSAFSCMPKPEKMLIYAGGKEKIDPSLAAKFVKTYDLSKTPNYELETAFGEEVDKAFEEFSASYEYFSYSLTPVGAIHPFSKVEVKCLFSSDMNLSVAKQACNVFFDKVDRRYDAVKN